MGRMNYPFFLKSASTISVAKTRISAHLGFTAANWDISAIHGDVWLIYDRFLFTSKPMIGHSEYISTWLTKDIVVRHKHISRRVTLWLCQNSY